MIELFVTIDATKLLDALSERARRRLFKGAYTEGLNYWHKAILPFHFMPGNSLLYPNAFTEKKKGGTPLVDTGEFRDRMMKQPEIRATFKGASARYAFGRPEKTRLKNSLFYSEYNRDIKAMDIETKKHIFNFMRGKNITFKEAVEQIKARHFKKTDYSRNTKDRMARGMKVFNQQDRERIKNRMKEFIDANIDTMGKANYKAGKF